MSGGHKRKKLSRFAMLALAGTALTFPALANATPAPTEILEGNYIKLGLNSIGTLGSGGSTSPGILYDGTGTGTFNSPYDYLTPGTPFEGFTISATSGLSGDLTNNNASVGSESITGGTLTAYNGVAYNGTTYDNRAVWTGTVAGVLTVTHDYYFNDADQQLHITTTIGALTNLTGVTFARFTDPDAVAASGDSSATNNFQGATGVAATDLVYAEALASKYVIGLFTNDTITHNSAVTGWTETTADYLAGGSVGDGDNTIGLGFNLGDLINGNLYTFNYSYIFGTNIAAAVGANGGGTTTPVTTTPTDIATGAPTTVTQLLSGEVEPVFNGGTLTLASTGSAPTDFTVKAVGGAIDTAGHDLTLSGKLSGDGVLDKTGAGTLTLTAANTHGGFAVSGGVLAFESDSSLGAAGGVLNISNSASLLALGDATVNHGIQIDAGQQGGFDTGAKNVVLAGAITGGGELNKLGAGSLTLTGVNNIQTLDIQAGSVVAGSSQSLGATNGQIILHAGTQFATAGNMTITQSVNIAGGDARFDTGANNVVLSGALSGNNCFIKAGTGQLTLTAAGSNAIGACVEQGALTFNSTFTGKVWVENGGSAGGGGLINGDVVVNGVLAPGNSPGRLVVAGSVTPSSTGVLSIDIDGPTAGVGAGHYDTLVLTGSGSVFTAAGTIAPITRGITGDATNTYTPKIGDAYEVVIAEGGVKGAFATLTQPTTGMPDNSRFDLVYMPRSVILAVTAKSYAALTSGSLNARAAGTAADRLRDANGVQTATLSGRFVAGLAGLNQARATTTLQQAAGEIHADSIDTTLQANRLGRAQVSTRVGQAFEGERQLWADVGGDNHKIQSDAYAGAYRTRNTSVILGLDQRIGDDLVIGGALSYGETDLNGYLMGAGKSFSYRGHAYAGWRSGDYYVNGVVSGGADVYKTSRTVEFSTGRLGFSAKADGSSLSADVEAGRHLAVGPMALTLAAGLASDNARRDALTETGDAAGALSFGKETRRALQGRIGGLVSTEATAGAIRLKPQASLFVMQEFGDETARLDAALQGQAFSVSAASPGETSVKLATGVEASISDRTRLSLGYRYGWSDNAESHAIRAAASFSW